MKYRDMGSVALKSVGVYWLAQALLYVKNGLLLPFSDFPKMAGMDWRVETVSWAMHGILYAVLGYLLTFRTELILSWINIDGAQEEDINSPEHTGNIEALAISLLGVYFAVPAISAIVPLAIKLWAVRLPTYDLTREAIIERTWPDLVGNIVELLLGLVLIIGRAGLARIWRLSRPMANQ
jgi:hypothetical protein